MGYSYSAQVVEVSVDEAHRLLRESERSLAGALSPAPANQEVA